LGDTLFLFIPTFNRKSYRRLRPHVEDYPYISVQGSTGAGNITAAPWIALFDRRLTRSATTDYYVVYLFSVDLSTVTLSLAFGTTQFEEQFGGPTAAFPRMRLAAGRLQEMFSHLIPENLARGAVDLRARPRQKLHFAYQEASVLSCAPYRIGALPEETELVADLRELVQIYTAIVSDPLETTVERLLEAVIEPAVRVESIELRDFEVRPPRRDREPGSARGGGRRYSPQSLKVGDAGERAVMRHEQERLARCGRPDLADRVRWHAQHREFVGWDITSFDDNGDELYIEVKSSIGKLVSCVALTVNEWQAACHVARRHRYFVYIVTEALSPTPRIERLQNPASYVDDGRLSCEAIVYELQLSPPISKFKH
jgi:hypothetical protein